MKLFLLLSLTTFALIAQDTYAPGKIDMHGGSQENYNSFRSYKTEEVRSFSMDMSKFLDKNTSKGIK